MILRILPTIGRIRLFFCIEAGTMVAEDAFFFQVNTGANGIDRTGRRSSGMPRMSVGLVKNPATFNLIGNSQLRMAA